MLGRWRASVARDRRYGRYPIVMQFGEGSRSRLQAYTLALYCWMNDQVGPIAVAWDVESTTSCTRLYFASERGCDTFTAAWGALLTDPVPPDLHLPIVPWPVTAGGTSQPWIVTALPPHGAAG